MIFSVTYHLDLHSAKHISTIDVVFYQVKRLMFNTVQTTNVTFVGKMWDIQ